ncbi:MAG: phosphotyrosine protein phosphatase [Leptothrix sp. (in: Bacteria)]|nr:phosphotyrosine protein phosphatase [Leptothrix sp. (in: b-proteobacteria)]
MKGGAGPRAGGAGGDAAELRVLMVCMGNICRSPTAEAVLRERLQRAGLARQVMVDSAGTLDHHRGEAPDPRAIRHAAQRGYDLSAQRARPVLADDFARFHWLLAMDEDNLAWLQRKAPPGHGARIELLMPHARRHTDVRFVPDPYYGGPAGFEHVLDLVEDACDGFVDRLRRELTAPRGV